MKYCQNSSQRYQRNMDTAKHENHCKIFLGHIEYIEEFENAKKFKFAPINKMSRRFTSIDTKELHQTMKNQRLLEIIAKPKIVLKVRTV